MKSHKELSLYQKAMDFVTEIYLVTKSFPESEKYGLSSQMRRAAVSIPSNIAEGAARRTTKEFIQFLYIALGSSAELETQIEIAKRLNMINGTDKLNFMNYEIMNMLSGLIKSLNSKIVTSDFKEWQVTSKSDKWLESVTSNRSLVSSHTSPLKSHPYKSLVTRHFWKSLLTRHPYKSPLKHLDQEKLLPLWEQTDPWKALKAALESNNITIIIPVTWITFPVT